MKRLIFIPILFLLLVFEGIALKLLPEKIINTHLLFVPHWVFIFLVLMGLFYDRNKSHYSIVYAAVFGLLIDIIYTNVLGVYMFAYALALYVVHLLNRVFHTNIYSTIFMTSVSIIALELLIKFIYMTINLTHMTTLDFLVSRLIPTLIANVVFLVLIYPLTTTILTRLSYHEK